MANQVDAKLVVQILANTAGLLKGLKQSQSQLSGFVSSVRKVAGAVGIAFGTREIISFASEAAKLAGQFEGVNNAFQKLPNSQKVLADLKEATQGTVSELELMRRTVQATNFGISLEQLPKLLEFAAVRAQQTGESVDYLVNSIVKGIGRKSPLILDNLGISATRLKEEFGGAALEAQSIADVTAAVGRIASEELTKMGRLTENTAVTMQQVAAAWENFKVSVGDGIVGDIFDKLAKDALTILRAFGPAAEQAKNWTETLARAIADPLARRSGGPSTAVLDDITERLKVLRKEAGAPITFNIEQLSERFKFTEQEIAIFLQRMEEVNKQLSLSERVMNQVTESANSSFDGDLSAAAAAQVKVLSDELATLESRLAKAAEQNQSAFSVEALNRQIAVRRESLAILNQYIAGLEEANADNDDSIGLVAALEAQIKAFGESIKEATSVEEIRRLQHELEGAKIRLDALLKPSIAPEPIKMPIEFGDLTISEDVTRQLLESVNKIAPGGLVIPIAVEVDPEKTDEDLAALKQSIIDFRTNAANELLALTDIMGNAAASVVSGQQSIVAALGQATIEIIDFYLKQALAAAITKSIQEGGPLPVGLALAAASVGIVRALFRKSIGKGGGGGGGGSSLSQSSRGIRTPEGRAEPIRVELGVTEFEIRGDKLTAAIKQNEFKQGRLGG